MNYTNLRDKIRGPIFPTITPFTSDYKVDVEKQKEYIDFLYNSGARIFYLMAYNGRFSLLSNDEVTELNILTASYIKSKYSDCIVIGADPMMCSTQVSIDVARKAKDAGADMISLIFMERYHFDDQVYKHFEEIANQVDIAMLIHVQLLDSIRGYKLYPMPLLDRIADIDNVIAIKEDSKQDLYTEEATYILKDRVVVMPTGRSKRHFMQFGPMGCQAYLVGIGSFFPQLAFDFYDAFTKHDMQGCWKIINDFERPFFRMALKHGWHPSLKSAMEHLGIMSRVERPPLCMLPDDQHQDIVKIVEDIKGQL